MESWGLSPQFVSREDDYKEMSPRDYQTRKVTHVHETELNFELNSQHTNSFQIESSTQKFSRLQHELEIFFLDIRSNTMSF